MRVRFLVVAVMAALIAPVAASARYFNTANLDLQLDADLQEYPLVSQVVEDAAWR